MNYTHLHVEAGIRYWEDATVDGAEDLNGDLIPFRRGDLWLPIIDIETGRILDWPEGMNAYIHYKVCDAGRYWLGTETERLAQWKGHYVPDAFLCHGDEGFGDYIILEVGKDGKIARWEKPEIEEDEWKRK